MSTRVFVVDDHPVFRDGLVALLGSVEDLDVVGAAGDGPEAIEALSDGCADVVLMDLNLPTMSGIEATARLAALPDPPAVLAVTMVDDDDTVLAAMRAGARGYVLKGSVGAEIVAAVRTVAAGGAVFGAGVATQVLALASPGGGAGREDDGLTEREREVLALLAEGANNAQIARALGVSLKTVQNYVSRILDKLQVSDRTQAALKARGRPSSR
ncbi:MAG TPA: response regulator transcription factor [Mycobacteriales bacterium]|nr:response regulator transcription factor [Mycobacteriales bacterium]